MLRSLAQNAVNVTEKQSLQGRIGVLFLWKIDFQEEALRISKNRLL